MAGVEQNLDSIGYVGGETLDDIISQNNGEIRRRQTLPQIHPYTSAAGASGMADFGSMSGDIHGYHFGPATTVATMGEVARGQVEGTMDMGLGYAGIHMSGPMGFSGAIDGHSIMGNGGNGVYDTVTQDAVHGMMNYGAMGMHGIAEEDEASVGLFAAEEFQHQFGAGAMEGLTMNDFMMQDEAPMPSQRKGGSNEQNEAMAHPLPRMEQPASSETNTQPGTLGASQSMTDYDSPSLTTTHPSISKESSFNTSDSDPLTVGPGGLLIPTLEPPDRYKDIYSSSNFDMVKALSKVWERKNPEIALGKVDLSCAFVICDLDEPDSPIVYVSDIFERLTGYSIHEVLGRNCRFLQSPDGKVQAGAKRQGFVDNDAVYYLKRRLDQNKEAQRSIINYRKGGQPFLNLLTMIPIPWDDPDKLKYVVGFQIDLVVKPEGLENKNASGNYTINYSQAELPKYVWHPPELPQQSAGHTLSRDDVSMLLQQNNASPEGEISKRVWDKLLLENSDDVVHVLSLKGLFLYLSPSCRTTLEYDPSELTGTALSSICHPSDIVPVTRELKETTTNTPVSVVFRIRRKNSGYIWFESYGCLNIEQGKGRKCIILVGRTRPVYALARSDIEISGDNEFWTKMSTSGMFLFVSSNVRTLLDRQPEDMIGTSMQALMRQESKVIFGRTLEKARAGSKVSHKYEVLNRRGVVLQALTTLYPGDATQGQKPTFLVAQIRLLKPTNRGSLSSTKKDPTYGPISPSPSTTPSSASISTPPSLTIPVTTGGSSSLALNPHSHSPPSNLFEELQVTRCTSWQFELRQMERLNRLLAEELALLLGNKKKRKRRRGGGSREGGEGKKCSNCGKGDTPEWRRGPTGGRELCNGCGLRWAKLVGRGGGGGGSGSGGFGGLQGMGGTGWAGGAGAGGQGVGSSDGGSSRS